MIKYIKEHISVNVLFCMEDLKFAQEYDANWYNCYILFTRWI